MTEQMKVFISSTSEDLREYRSKVRDAILDMQLFPDGMENWVATDTTAIDLCRRKVDEAHIYIGIYAHRYGWQPEGYNGKSITELEYDWATERKIPRLCFVVNDAYSWPDELRDKEQDKIESLKLFKNRVKKRIVSFFTTSDDLRAKVTAALANVINGGDNTSLEEYLIDLAEEIRSNQASHIIALVAESSKQPSISNSEKQDRITDENVLQLTRRYEQCVIIGEGGIGKTQTLYQLVLEAVEASSISKDAPIPIFIRLSEWGTSHISSIQDYIVDKWQQYGLNTYGSPLTLLSTGRAILFADGVNEINAGSPEAQKKKLSGLFRWIDKREGTYPRYAILTCRVGDYLYFKDTFAFTLPIVEIQPLTESQIRSIAESNFEDVDNFIAMLNKSGHFDLAQNPWFLNNLIELYHDESHLPSNQGQLLRTLIERRAEREVRKDNPFWATFKPQLLKLQKKYAELTFSASSRGYYSDIAVSFSHEQIQNLKEEDVKAAEAIGIVVTTTTGLRFAHQRYAEYFAALYISDHLNELTNVVQKPYLSSYRWRSETERSTQPWDQPIILLSGVVADAEQIITKVAEIDPWLAAMCIGSGCKVSLVVENKIVQALFQSLKAKKEECYRASIQAFVQIGRNCVDSLILELRRNDENTRDAAIQALGLIGELRASATLLAMLETIDYEEYPKTSALIVEALKLLGDRRAVPIFLHIVDQTDDSYNFRQADFYVQLALTLGEWKIEEAVKPLIQLNRKGKGPDADEATVRAIGKIGIINEQVNEFLFGQLKYGRSEAAAESLALLNIAEAIEPLLEKLRSRDGKESVAKALHHLSFSSLENFIAETTLSNNLEDRAYIAKLIGWLQEIKFLPFLRQLLEDPSSEVRAACVDAIKLFQAQIAVSIIAPMLLDVASHVRQQTARALDELGWLKYYRASVEEQVRYHAARGSNGDWRDIREKFADRAVPLLIALLHDGDSDVAYSAATTLEQIGWNPLSIEEKAWFFAAKKDYAACVSLGQKAIPAVVHKLKTSRYGRGIQETFSPLLRLNAAHEVSAFLYAALHGQKLDNRLRWGLGNSLMYEWECWLDNRETIENEQVEVLIPPLLDALLGQEEIACERAEWVFRNYPFLFPVRSTEPLQRYFNQNEEAVLALVKYASRHSDAISWIIERTGRILIDAVIKLLENEVTEEELKTNCIACLSYSTEAVAVDTLKSQLISTNQHIRSAVISAISRHPSPQIILLLIEALDDDASEVANEALYRLVRIGIDAVSLLREATKSEKAKIRAGVISALGQILQYRERHRSSRYGSPINDL